MQELLTLPKKVFATNLGKIIGVQEIVQRWKKRTCPFCGIKGSKYMATNICKEHGEYWDVQYMDAIDMWIHERGKR